VSTRRGEVFVRGPEYAGAQRNSEVRNLKGLGLRIEPETLGEEDL
jgi:hypothetical protein